MANIVETLVFQRAKSKVPFKVVGWNGGGKKPRWLKSMQDTVSTKDDVNGWTTRGPATRLANGIYTRTWKKGDFIVCFVNEAEGIFEGEEYISFWGDTLEALLHFTKDMGLDQDKILKDAIISQRVRHLPYEEKQHRPPSQFRRSV